MVAGSMPGFFNEVYKGCIFLVFNTEDRPGHLKVPIMILVVGH